jgi:hypothetical protein
MKTEHLHVQSPNAKIHFISINKPFYIYYAHSIKFYNTETERRDLKFLRTVKHVKVLNPNGLALGKDMFRYLFKVKQCDAVWYRGTTIGVVFEVLTALAMGKPVYSLETKDIMNRYEILDFINIFVNNEYVEHDLVRFKKIFPEYYDNFVSMLGYMP